MSLVNNFEKQISDLCDVSASAKVVPKGLLVNNQDISLEGIFSSSNASFHLGIYLSGFEVDPSDPRKARLKNDRESYYKAHPLKLNNTKISHGIYETFDVDGRRCVIFTGSFGTSSGEPELIEFPEVLLALTLLPPSKQSPISNWSNFLEALGPFAICNNSELPSLDLADCGLFPALNTKFSFDWDNQPGSIIPAISPDTPVEACNAYIEALANSHRPDVAYLQLYRVLEILFAIGLRNKIAKAPTDKILGLVGQFKASEIDMLDSVISLTEYTFSSFTLEDFASLYGTHRPNGTYDEISNWMKSNAKNPTTIFPSTLRVKIIYYVRCSLVHTKLGSSEPYLIGPFDPKQETALTHLVGDLRRLIRSLLT